MSISLLCHLRELDISSNQLHSLPSSVVALSQLRVIKFACNSLEYLPAEFGPFDIIRQDYRI
jgi:Leucine-rich repeat (LRR) protein